MGGNRPKRIRATHRHFQAWSLSWSPAITIRIIFIASLKVSTMSLCPSWQFCISEVRPHNIFAYCAQCCAESSTTYSNLEYNIYHGSTIQSVNISIVQYTKSIEPPNSLEPDRMDGLSYGITPQSEQYRLVLWLWTSTHDRHVQSTWLQCLEPIRLSPAFTLQATYWVTQSCGSGRAGV